MEKTISFMIERKDKEKDKRVEKIMEEVLGISIRTKLEKLADSFSNVKYCVYPDKENEDIGFIKFTYTEDYIIKKEKSQIKEVAERFYNKDNYMILTTTSDYGFDIIIFDNFFKNISKKSKKKSS